MPFIPHTEQDIQEMLQQIGVSRIEELFDEIPLSLRQSALKDLPEGMSEMALKRLMTERAAQDGNRLCFIGAGAYEHHIPAAVWALASRGEFMTAYTPYQAEASQGGLQLLYEYQTMMANLMAMEVSNASLYDGASALAEAILMAVRLTKNAQKTTVIVPRSVHPHYRQVVNTIVSQQAIKIIEVPYQPESGRIAIDQLPESLRAEIAALVIPQPNFFGILEMVDALAEWAESQGILTIAVTNPLSMALLKPPGQWGRSGVDIACGEGQPLGIPLASGGPYYGFLCCKKAHIRQMPGRVVGRTVDLAGKTGYVLTLQAREQHIRRAKATSNICTNQGLMVTASTIYMSLMGPQGLRQIAVQCHQQALHLKQQLSAISGVEIRFSSPFFHEIVWRCNLPANEVLEALGRCHIQAGYALENTYKELSGCILTCVTETKTAEDIAWFAENLRLLTQSEGRYACQA